MALDRIVSMVLRVAELVFAAIVAGVNGEYLHKSDASSWTLGRFIYTEVVAGIAIFLAILRLFPFASHFVSWPVDIFVSILWWVAFGLLVDLVGSGCGGVFNWSNVAPRGDSCGKMKAVIAFAFLSAVLWLASALVGFFWVRSRERSAAKVDAAHHSRRHGRRGWGRRSRV